MQIKLTGVYRNFKRKKNVLFFSQWVDVFFCYQKLIQSAFLHSFETDCRIKFIIAILFRQAFSYKIYS